MRQTLQELLALGNVTPPPVEAAGHCRLIRASVL